jgi:hypothetical protein
MKHKEQEVFRGSAVRFEIAEDIDWKTNNFGKANMESCACEGKGSKSEEDDEG